MKRLLTSVITAVCAVGLISVFLVPSASAAPWTPRDGVIFNNPKGSLAAENAIITQLNRAIERAPKGSSISMAMYLFDKPSTARRLYAAHLRGVNVQIIIDDGERSPEIRYLKQRLGTNKKARSFVASCYRSCMSQVAGSVSHSKFFIFSRVGNTPNVSMISSANPHNVNTEDSWNNIHTIASNATIYRSLRGYFVDMLKDKQNLNYYDTRKPIGSGKYKLYFFPRKAKAGVQTVNLLDVLNHVSCRRVSKGYGSGGRTVVRIAMWGWTTARMDIAKRAWTLKNQGCKVDVILNQGRASRAIIQQLIKKTKYGQIPVYNAWVDRNRNDFGELYVHHKAVIVNGRWFGKGNVKVVYTGSQNFTSTGTRLNDELMLRVRDNGIYNAYSRNFSYIAGKYAPRMRKMPPRIILRNSAARAKFGPQVNPTDGISAAEARILDAEQDAKIEASIDR